MIHVAILAGGSGTRFWPKSRARLPKQFLRFGQGPTLLEQTYARTRRVAPAERTWVITAAAHEKRVRALLPQVPAAQIVGEPAARDTAAAVALAALLVRQADPDATLLVCPADHVIEPAARFAAAARAAQRLLVRDRKRIVVFGIRPTEPATGFGYIERGRALGRQAGLPAFDVVRFHEKPKLPRAQRYVASRRFFWNAGIFCFRAETLLEAVARLLPGLGRALALLPPASGRPRFRRELARVYRNLRRISIDRGVLERWPHRAVVVPDYRWEDVGSFAALARVHAADADGNVVLGRSVALDARGNVVDAGSGLVALLGVRDLVVVHTDDVTLVCPKRRSEEVKLLLERVQARGDLARHR